MIRSVLSEDLENGKKIYIAYDSKFSQIWTSREYRIDTDLAKYGDDFIIIRSRSGFEAIQCKENHGFVSFNNVDYKTLMTSAEIEESNEKYNKYWGKREHPEMTLTLEDAVQQILDERDAMNKMVEDATTEFSTKYEALKHYYEDKITKLENEKQNYENKICELKADKKKLTDEKEKKKEFNNKNENRIKYYKNQILQLQENNKKILKEKDEIITHLNKQLAEYKSKYTELKSKTFDWDNFDLEKSYKNLPEHWKFLIMLLLLLLLLFLVLFGGSS